MMVVFYHLYGAIADEVSQWIPRVADILLKHGYLGVQIFFVLSGYAIASSFGNSRVDARFVGWFALRRSIRLDPPYWLSIALALLASSIAAALIPSYTHESVSVWKLLAHIFYLQDLLGLGGILPHYWTLAIEIQFYLFFALAILAGQYCLGVGNIADALKSPRLRFCLLAFLALSVAVYSGLVAIPIRGTFVQFWFYFHLGMTICWFGNRWVSARFMLFTVLIILAGMVYRPMNVGTGLATFAVMLMVRIWLWDRQPLSGSVFQYLGRISYSLYLFHPTIGWSLISLGKRAIGPELSIAAAFLLFITGTVASIVFSHVVCLLLEWPAQRFSRRISVPKSRSGILVQADK